MALVRIPFLGLIFRPFVKQKISQDCLFWLLGQINPERNFDGEIMVLGAMSSHDMEARKKVLIEGHTDDRGEAQDNFVIARDRATNVLDYLVSQGIDATKLTAISKGETAPLTENNTEEGRSKNRRIEIIVN